MGYMNNGHASDGYRASVDINEQVQQLLTLYYTSRDQRHLVQIHEVLLPITRQEVMKVIRKCCLSRDLRDDMVQEAWLKLQEAADYNYDRIRCPVFITFWRTSVYRHLLTKFYTPTKDVAKELGDHDEPEPPTDPTDAIYIEELRKKYADEINGWGGYYINLIPMCLALLNERILIEEERQTPQDALARRFSRSQGYLSKWETWLALKVREEHMTTKGRLI